MMPGHQRPLHYTNTLARKTVTLRLYAGMRRLFYAPRGRERDVRVKWKCWWAWGETSGQLLDLPGWWTLRLGWCAMLWHIMCDF